MLHPRIDPRLIGRTVKHTIGATAGAGHVEQQLGKDQTTRAGADLPCSRRHQRAGEPVSEKRLERHRAALRANELPPALLLPLLIPPLITARQKRQQPLHQHRLLLDRDAKRRGPLNQEPADHTKIIERLRAMGSADHLVTATGPGDHHPGRRRQPVQHGAIAGRDPAHRVRDMSIEPRKEPKPVLGRQIRSTVNPRARHRQAARLAAGNRPALDHHHVEPALRQLMSSGQPAHPAAQHRHPRHGRNLLAHRRPPFRATHETRSCAATPTAAADAPATPATGTTSPHRTRSDYPDQSHAQHRNSIGEDMPFGIVPDELRCRSDASFGVTATMTVPSGRGRTRVPTCRSDAMAGSLRSCRVCAIPTHADRKLR